LPALKGECYNDLIMKLKREEVLHIAKLARVGVTDEDVERFSEQLSDILANFEILQQVDTSDVPPTAQPNPLQNVTKDDQPADSLLPGQILANAPRKERDYFRVKVVLE
jgi:aspartyl-tRNA(Asn)/glutamyl-tRNA(Gln) amidotransferase subunit C